MDYGHSGTKHRTKCSSLTERVCLRIIGTNAPPVIKFCVGFLFLFDFLCERNVQSQSAGSLSIIYKWSAIYVARAREKRALPGSKVYAPRMMSEQYGAASRFMFAQHTTRPIGTQETSHQSVCREWIYWTWKNCLSVCNWKQILPARSSIHRSTLGWKEWERILRMLRI